MRRAGVSDSDNVNVRTVRRGAYQSVWHCVVKSTSLLSNQGKIYSTSTIHSSQTFHPISPTRVRLIFWHYISRVVLSQNIVSLFWVFLDHHVRLGSNTLLHGLELIPVSLFWACNQEPNRTSSRTGLVEPVLA